MKQEKLLEKMLRLSIKGNEVETLLESLGFVKRQGKGSHVVWMRTGFEPLTLARHGKEYKKGYLRQIITVLRNGGIINNENDTLQT